MKNLVAVSLSLALLFTLVASAQERNVGLKTTYSEQRVALVIGNADYETAPLKNPVNDAQDMASALGKSGFDVTYLKNLSLKDMKLAIQAFGQKLRNGGAGLFYYAGHGLQVNQINYLVPVDAKIQSAAEVEFECIDAGFVLAQMENAGNRINVMILDACRNNPFTRRFRSAARGLARMDAPSGILIAYATKPGSIAGDGDKRNGVYTQELLRFMRVPGLKIQDVFYKVRESVSKLTEANPEPQVPWEETSLIGDFYFEPPTPPVPVPTSTVSADELLEIIKTQQRLNVKESWGVNMGQNFSNDDLKVFKEKNVTQAITESLRHDDYFIDVVLAIKGMASTPRQKLLGDALKTYKKSWAEFGCINREAQTEAGQEAERLIANAIVRLVNELYTLPVEKLNALRK
jgi:hypothetical protein